MGQEALSMFNNIASKAKNVLGGVATQVANSMPQIMKIVNSTPQVIKVANLIP